MGSQNASRWTIWLISLALCSCSFFYPPKPKPTDIAQPPILATTPTPEGGQLGGISGVFVSERSSNGPQGTKCYGVFRLYEDGFVLYSQDICLSSTTTFAESWDEIGGWFRREDLRPSRGEYHTLGRQIWMLIPYNYQFRTAWLDFRGEYTEDSLSLIALDLYIDNGPYVLQTPVEYLRLTTDEP